MISRFIVFYSVIGLMVLIMTLSTFKNIAVDNSKFDFDKAYQAHAAKQLDHNKLEMAENVGAMSEGQQLASGEKLFAKCTMCHGKQGEGMPSMKAAHIGGQYNWYIEKQLNDMKAGTIRANEAMNPTLKSLSEQDIKDVAAYVATLPWKKVN